MKKSDHVLDRGVVLLSIPPRYRCSCGEAHSSEEYRDIVTEEVLAAWSVAVSRACGFEVSLRLPSDGDADGQYGEDR